MAYKPELWAEAKRKCRLNESDIRMAKEMGLNPKSLIKNIPSPKEQWKLPVKDWIHEMYEDRQRKQKKKAAVGNQAPTRGSWKMPMPARWCPL